MYPSHLHIVYGLVTASLSFETWQQCFDAVQTNVLTFTQYVWAEPRGSVLDGQALGSGEAVGHVPRQTLVLNGGIQIERCLLWHRVVAGMVDLRWVLAVNCTHAPNAIRI